MTSSPERICEDDIGPGQVIPATDTEFTDGFLGFLCPTKFFKSVT